MAISFPKEHMTILTGYLIVTKTKKPPQSPAQKSFNQLWKSIKALQEAQEKTTQELEASLQFYYTKIRPEELAIQRAFQERVKIGYELYKTSTRLSKKDLKSLKQFILEDIEIVCALSDGDDISVEIQDIFKDLAPVVCDDSIAQELPIVDEKIEEVFEKFYEAFQDADERTYREPKKSKKQREKEQQRGACEDAQKKTLSTIYKHLARALHPDLEQDGQQKIWKEGLMRRLTSAYKKSDLYELLAIEMEYANHLQKSTPLHSSEQFQAYNAILKDQAKELQRNIDLSWLQPKYTPIQQFRSRNISLKAQHKYLKGQAQEIQGLVKRLQTQDAVELFKRAIKERYAK